MPTEAALSVVIPVLNAARYLPACLGALRRGAPAGMEVVLADGGSTDGTQALGERLGARVVAAPRGRGVQVAAAIEQAQGGWLLVLHADTRLGPGWGAAAAAFMRSEGRAAYFRFALDDDSPRARLLERAVAWRCRVLGLPYGDQGLLIPRALLEQLGGYPALPLMEDVALVRRLGRARLVALDVPALTSAERWRREGWTRRSARNLFCLGLWFLGVPPRIIARVYGR
jgi:rSAM/selenodomain-associated transferase 2